MKFTMDGVSFQLKKSANLDWLARYGRVFCAFDQNDSGNLCFGVEGKRRYFVKIAGLHTLNAAICPAEAVDNLKKAVQVYCDLAHPKLIRLIDAFEIDTLYVAVFEWSVGECLFDHWNFEHYEKHPELLSPMARFRALPVSDKLQCADTLLDFLTHIADRGYVAVDFYDSSILYDFQTGDTTICDIDLFCKAPHCNRLGTNYWGTKRLKAPEEYVLGAEIDTRTNVFTLGALFSHLFGEYSRQELDLMYEQFAFFPCRRETWTLSDARYTMMCKATAPEREMRYLTMDAFSNAWNAEKTIDRK